MANFRLRPIDAAGFRGRCAVAGRPFDPPAVLLATALVRAEAYRATLEQLARHFRVYLVEMPGDGRSARLPAPWSLADYAGWVAALVDALGLRGATVIGHSHSGGVALLLPALHPGRAGQVVVADGVGAEPFPLWRGVLGQLADAATVEYALAAREWSRLLYTAFAHPRNFFRQVRAALDADLTPFAASVRVPVLLAWGARDHTVPPRCARVLARHLPHPTVYLSPRGSHCWPITYAREFADVVAAWVRRPAGSPGAGRIG